MATTKVTGEYCSRCEEPLTLDSPDGAFCRECFDYYDRPDALERMRAAVCYLQAAHPRGNKRMEVAAFLSIVRPDIPEDRVRKILMAVGE